jgi:hypothetical protein
LYLSNTSFSSKGVQLGRIGWQKIGIVFLSGPYNPNNEASLLKQKVCSRFDVAVVDSVLRILIESGDRLFATWSITEQKAFYNLCKHEIEVFDIPFLMTSNQDESG